MSSHKNILFKLPKITLLIFFLGTAALQAVESSIETYMQNKNIGQNEQHLVLEVYPQWYSSDKYSVQGKNGVAREFENNKWMMYYLSPSATYALDYRFALHGGLGLYYKDYREDENRWEARPYVGVSHFTSWTEKWTLSTYLRMEERYYEFSGDRSSFHTSRLRFRLQSSYTFDPDDTIFSMEKLVASAEIFKSANRDRNSTNIDDNDDYETRIVLGLEQKLNKQEKIRFELAWQYQSSFKNLATSSANKFYFKIKYYPVWGSPLGNILFHRNVEE